MTDARQIIISGCHILFLMMSVVLCPVTSHARAYHSLDEALELVFLGASHQRHPYYLSESETKKLAEAVKKTGIRSGFRESLVVRYDYVKDGKVIGHAYSDTSRQRTLPQSLLIAIKTDGTVSEVIVLQNKEPPKYHPGKTWLKQFEGRSDPDVMDLNDEITGITGATMTSASTVRSVKKVLVIHSFLKSMDKSRGSEG